MKLVIDRNTLLNALSFSIQFVPSKSANNAMLNFLFDCNDCLLIKATDGVESSVYTIPKEDIKEYENGKCLVPAKYLYDIVQNLKDNEITLNLVDNKYLKVFDSKNSFKLINQNPDDFPSIDFDTSNEYKSFSTKLEKINRLTKAVSYACATTGTKEIFYGIDIKSKDNKLTFSATDSYRLAQAYALEKESEEDNSFEFVCPLKVLNVLNTINDNVDCTLYYNGNSAMFYMNKIMIVTRLINGEFPDFNKIASGGYKSKIRMSKNDFVSAANCSKILSNIDNKNFTVKFTMSKDKTYMTTKSLSYGDSESMIDGTEVVFEDENEKEFSISFNVNYVLDVVKVIEDDYFVIYFSTPTKLFLIKSPTKNDIHIVTPIKTL